MFRIILAFLLSVTCIAQDEWFLNDMLGRKSDNVIVRRKKVHFNTKSKAFNLDLNGDKRKEFVRFEIEDGKFYLLIYDFKGERLLKYKFQSYGYGSHVYKVTRRKIGPEKVAILFHFFDGKTGYLKRKGTATLYGIITNKRNIEELKVQKITSVWLESKNHNSYLRREYRIGFEDINVDGELDLIVQTGNVKRTFYTNNSYTWKSM